MIEETTHVFALRGVGRKTWWIQWGEGDAERFRREHYLDIEEIRTLHSFVRPQHPFRLSRRAHAIALDLGWRLAGRDGWLPPGPVEPVDAPDGLLNVRLVTPVHGLMLVKVICATDDEVQQVRVAHALGQRSDSPQSPSFGAITRFAARLLDGPLLRLTFNDSGRDIHLFAGPTPDPRRVHLACWSATLDDDCAINAVVDREQAAVAFWKALKSLLDRPEEETRGWIPARARREGLRSPVLDSLLDGRTRSP